MWKKNNLGVWQKKNVLWSHSQKFVWFFLVVYVYTSFFNSFFFLLKFYVQKFVINLFVQLDHASETWFKKVPLMIDTHWSINVISLAYLKFSFNISIHTHIIYMLNKVSQLISCHLYISLVSSTRIGRVFT